MYKRYGLLVLALSLLTIARPTTAADRVRLERGNQVSGRISDTSATTVVIVTGTKKRELPVNEIDTVQFDAEPNELSQARIAVNSGRYDDAVAMLGKVEARDLKRPEIAKEVEYYKALAAAHMALAGDGSIAEAGKRMFGFERANRDSFHYFQACQTLGDLLAALGRYADAQTYYDKLAAAPWPDYKMRAGVLVGRSLLSQKKYDEAVSKFDAVLNTKAEGDGAAAQQAAAALGKAAAYGGQGKTDEAVKLVDQVIAKADPQDEELHARAYNVLGNCYTAAGRKKEALLAFLHVDLLYARFGELHAEALANLATLWSDVDKSQRAAEARNRLKEQYPNSVWAAK